MSRWAWLATVAIGCGHPAAPVTPAPGTRPPTAARLDDDLPRLAERMATLYRDWARAFAEAGVDCAAATTKVDALATANQDVIDAGRRVLAAGHAKIVALREARQPYDAEIDANAKAIFGSPTLAKCKDNHELMRALDRFGGEQ